MENPVIFLKMNLQIRLFSSSFKGEIIWLRTLVKVY